jgi:nucleoside-diphosphate-sugar epimerase
MSEERSVVLTGATGFLGAFLLAGLLSRGYRVTVLGRASKEKSLNGRLASITKWLDVDPKGHLNALEADFSQRHMGLSDKAYARLCTEPNRIIHCASDTSFLERHRDRVMEANVGGLSSILGFAEDSKAQHFYYIGTAYATGQCCGLCREAPAAIEYFTNVYEESKAMAEGVIQKRCNDTGMPLSILRPSIVYGDSKTGKALKFNALYYAMKALLLVRDIFIRDIKEQEGARSQKWGFSLDSGGTLHMPLNVYMPGEGSANLISVDHFVDAAITILEHPQSEGIYHITCDDPSEIAALMEYAERYAKVKGIRIRWNPAGRNPDPNPAEEMFDRLIEPYRPYFSDRRIFDRSRMKAIAPDLSSPPFSYDIFERCINYALSCDWGKTEGFPK